MKPIARTITAVLGIGLAISLSEGTGRGAGTPPVILSCNYASCEGGIDDNGVQQRCTTQTSAHDFELTVETTTARAHGANGPWFTVTVSEDSISWSMDEQYTYNGNTWTTNFMYVIKRNTLGTNLATRTRVSNHPGWVEYEGFTGACQKVQRQL
jgi:hypothetical protein